jgi:anaphase-promoting complex subunit 8
LEEEEDLLDEDEFQLGKSYFEMKEFDRVVWVLRESRGKRAKFLRIYSAYLVSSVFPDLASSPSVRRS